MDHRRGKPQKDSLFPRTPSKHARKKTTTYAAAACAAVQLAYFCTPLKHFPSLRAKKPTASLFGEAGRSHIRRLLLASRIVVVALTPNPPTHPARLTRPSTGRWRGVSKNDEWTERYETTRTTTPGPRSLPSKDSQALSIQGGMPACRQTRE